MNIHFNSWNHYVMSSIKENVLPTLTAQQKKISIVVSLALAFLAACYVAYYIVSHYIDPNTKPQVDKFNPSELTEILASKDKSRLFAYLAKHGTDIETLQLKDLAIEDQDLEFIIKHCLNLKNIELNDSSITDQGLEYLKALTSLQTLNLRFCKKITDQGLEHLKALTSLRSLNLRGCRQITDQGLEHLKALTSLQSLDLGWCNKIT